MQEGVSMDLYWSSFADFVAMGGYGPYVWGSYGVVAGTVLIEILGLVARRASPGRGEDA